MKEDLPTSVLEVLRDLPQNKSQRATPRWRYFARFPKISISARILIDCARTSDNVKVRNASRAELRLDGVG